MKSKRSRVVAMSGGVDSSVAAALLLREGYDVHRRRSCGSARPQGVEADEAREPLTTADATGGKNKQGCCSVLDAADARRVAGMLGIPFYVLNFQEDFGRVIDYFVDEYNRGRTPNPCVRCNDWLKFGKLAKYAEAVGADYVASGHYARSRHRSRRPASKALLRGLDHRKDQSYVLFGMTPRRAGSHAAADRRVRKARGPRDRRGDEAAGLQQARLARRSASSRTRTTPAWSKRRSPETFRAGEFVDDRAAKSSARTPATSISRSASARASASRCGYPIYVVDIDPASNRVTRRRQGGAAQARR